MQKVRVVCVGDGGELRLVGHLKSDLESQQSAGHLIGYLLDGL